MILKKLILNLCGFLDSLAPARLALRANLRLLYLALTLTLGCVLCGQIQAATVDAEVLLF